MIKVEDIKKEEIFYEDQLVFGILSKEPVNEGHVVIFPKQNAKSIEELDKETFIQMNYVATFVSTIIFEVLKLQGTNIIYYGKTDNPYNRVNIQIIGRKLNDNLQLMWTPKKAANLDEVQAKIKDQTFFIGKEVKKENNEEEKKEKKEIEAKEGEVNYLLKHLIRIP